MDFATGLGVFLVLVGLAVTVTPRVANSWAAYVAWLAVALYGVWFFGSRRQEIPAFVSEHRALVGSGAVGLLLISLGFLRQSKRRAQIAAAAAEAAKQRDFDSFPVGLGIVDHGVNVIASMDAVMQSLHQARPAASRIQDYLFVRLPLLLPSKGDPDHAIKKQAIFREAAGTLRDDVLLLEDVAAKVELESARFTEACRAILRLPVSSDGDAKTLREMKSTYARAAFPLEQVAVILHSTSAKIGRLQGNQQDLSRVVTRTTAAMEKIARIAADISKFFATEVANTIDRKL